METPRRFSMRAKAGRRRILDDPGHDLNDTGSRMDEVIFQESRYGQYGALRRGKRRRCACSRP